MRARSLTLASPKVRALAVGLALTLGPSMVSAQTAEGGSSDEPEAATQGSSAAPSAPALTPEAQQRIGVVPGDVPAWPDPDRFVHRTLIPPFFLHERTGGRRTTVVFPFFFRDRRGDRTTLLVPPYFRLRAPEVQADVVFPLWFHWRGQEPGPEGERWSTHVIPPVYWHSWEGAGENHGLALGVAPLFFYGESWGRDGALQREHLVMPPLLTYHTWRPDLAVSVVGPFYYHRRNAERDWGLAPLFFAGDNLSRNYLFIPGLLTWHSEDHDARRALTVVGPFWTSHGPSSFSLNLAPLFFHSHDATSARTTVLPLFHYGRSAQGMTLVTPLAVYDRTGSASTLVTPLYQNHRGATNWDAVFPFFYRSREVATGAHTEMVFPLFYHRWTASRNAWWIAPTVHYESEGNDWQFNIHPLVYTGRSGASTHTVVAPLFWDFHNEVTGSRTTVVAPLFWRFATPTSLTELVGNFLWISSERAEGRSYEWHLLPLFSYARPRPEDLSWNVLFGLVGYTRAGTHRRLRLFWIPIGL